MEKPIEKWGTLIARVLFSWFFIVSAFGHLTMSGQMAEWVRARGLPAPQLGVILTGLVILAGGLSILLGYKAKIGGWLLIVFLVPTALLMHNFWAIADPGLRSMQFVNFSKNIVIAGAALEFALHGAGTLSLDAWRQSRAASSPAPA